MKEYRGRGLTPPPDLDLGGRWVWEVGFRLVLAFPRGYRNRPRQRLHRQLGGPRSRSWSDQLEASLQRTELWFCNPWPVALLWYSLPDSTYEYCQVFINFAWLVARVTSYLHVHLPFSNKEVCIMQQFCKARLLFGGSVWRSVWTTHDVETAFDRRVKTNLTLYSYGATGWEIWGSKYGRDKRYVFFISDVETGWGAHPASCS